MYPDKIGVAMNGQGNQLFMKPVNDANLWGLVEVKVAGVKIDDDVGRRLKIVKQCSRYLGGKGFAVLATEQAVYIDREKRPQAVARGDGLRIDGRVDMHLTFERFRLGCLQFSQMSGEKVAQVDAFQFIPMESGDECNTLQRPPAC
jgi:hypothetical protein